MELTLAPSPRSYLTRAQPGVFTADNGAFFIDKQLAYRSTPGVGYIHSNDRGALGNVNLGYGVKQKPQAKVNNLL